MHNSVLPRKKSKLRKRTAGKKTNTLWVSDDVIVVGYWWIILLWSRIPRRTVTTYHPLLKARSHESKSPLTPSGYFCWKSRIMNYDTLLWRRQGSWRRGTWSLIFLRYSTGIYNPHIETSNFGLSEVKNMRSSSNREILIFVEAERRTFYLQHSVPCGVLIMQQHCGACRSEQRGWFCDLWTLNRNFTTCFSFQALLCLALTCCLWAREFGPKTSRQLH